MMRLGLWYPGQSAELTGVAARYAVTGASSLLHESLSANLIGQPAVFPRLSQLVLGSAAVNPKVGPRQKFINEAVRTLEPPRQMSVESPTSNFGL
jgi:hypothetical protein